LYFCVNLNYRLYILLFLISQTWAQSLVFEKTYTFATNSSIFAGLDTTTDGYIASISQGYGSIYTRGIFTKLNLLGDTMWKYKNDTPKENVWITNPVLNMNNSCYFASTWFRSNHSDTSLCVMNKFKGNTPEFKKRYSFPNSTSYITTSMIKESENEILFFGYIANTYITTGEGGGKKFAILKTDTNGVLLFQKVYYFGEFVNLMETSNIVKYPPHNYAMYGRTPIIGGSKAWPYIMKVNQNYDTIATKTIFSESENDYFYPLYGNMIYTQSNHFVCSGSNSNVKTVVQKSDTNLNRIWVKSIGVNNTFQSRLIELSNDTLLLVTIERESKKIWLFKLRGSDGATLDSVSITSTMQGTLMELSSAILRGNGQLVLAGSGDKDFFIPGIGYPYLAVIQMPPGTRAAKKFEFNLTSDQMPSKEPKSELLAVPNPAQDQVTIHYQLLQGEAIVQIIDVISGKVQQKANVLSTQTQVTLSVANLATGVYMYQLIKNGNIISTQKLVIMK
jgi:hypothetical protein